MWRLYFQTFRQVACSVPTKRQQLEGKLTTLNNLQGLVDQLHEFVLSSKQTIQTMKNNDADGKQTITADNNQVHLPIYCQLRGCGACFAIHTYQRVTLILLLMRYVDISQNIILLDCCWYGCMCWMLDGAGCWGITDFWSAEVGRHYAGIHGSESRGSCCQRHRFRRHTRRGRRCWRPLGHNSQRGPQTATGRNRQAKRRFNPRRQVVMWIELHKCISVKCWVECCISFDLFV